MAHEYIEPTRTSRIKLGLLVVAGALASLAMELWWHPFMDYVRSLPLCEGLPWLRGILIAFCLGSWLLSLVLLRASVLTFRSGQTPFPSAWVWSRTRVRTGWFAQFSGAGFAALALVLAASPVVVGYIFQAHAIFCMPASCGC